MGPHHWSKNPEENQTSDPNGYVQKNWPAKSMGPAVRGLMATAACARDDSLGTLVATLGANNVYTVNTNEGLIDPLTQINGLTPAITKPFLTRVVLPAMNTPVATTAPTIIFDGAAAVPLVRRDGSALVDNDLTGVPVEILGDTITSGAYSRARILDILPSDIKGVLAGRSVFSANNPQILVPQSVPTVIRQFGGTAGALKNGTTFDNATGIITIGAGDAGHWLANISASMQDAGAISLLLQIDQMKAGSGVWTPSAWQDAKSAAGMFQRATATHLGIWNAGDQLRFLVQTASSTPSYQFGFLVVGFARQG